MDTFEAMISLLTSHVWWWIIPADNNHFPYFLHWYFWVSAFFRQIHLHWPKLTMKNPPFYSLYSPVIHVFSHSYNHLSIPLNIPLYHPTISSHHHIYPTLSHHTIPFLSQALLEQRQLFASNALEQVTQRHDGTEGVYYKCIWENYNCYLICLLMFIVDVH